MATWNQAIEKYEMHLRAGGVSSGTIRIHRHYLRLIRCCAPSPGMVSQESLEHLLAGQTWAPETRRSARSVARVFFSYAKRVGFTASDPAEDLPKVTVPSGVARPASDEIIKEAVRDSDARTELMLRFAAHCGLRACEIAKIHGKDWDGQMLIVMGKGRKRRLVPVADQKLKRELNRCSSWLFPSPKGGPLTAGHVGVLLSKSLPDGVTGHMLRHRFATTAYQGTRDLLAVSAVLGHSKPETTRRYVQLPTDSLAAVVAAAS